MKINLPLFLFTICLVNVCIGQTISVSPSTVTAGQTLNVTITGSGTHFTSASSTANVEFGFSSCSGTVNSITVNSDVNLVANVTVPSNFIYNGYYDVEVFEPVDGHLLIDRGLNLTGAIPAPITISPDSGAPGQMLNVTITGNGTHFLQGSSSTLDFDLDLNQLVCQESWAGFVANPSSNTSASVLVTIPPGTPGGYYDLYFSGGSDYYLVDNIFHVISGVSVNEVEKEYKISIGPNPFNTHTFLEYSLEQAVEVKTEIYDLYGKRILENNLGRQAAGKYNLKIDAANLNFTSGIYLLRFTADNRSFTKRIMLNTD